MYYEEKMIKGVLHYSTDPDGEWKAVSIETLSSRSEELRQVKKNLKYQSARIRELGESLEAIVEAGRMCDNSRVQWIVEIANEALNKTEIGGE